ncbi:MAG TPA: ABC transporter substrate-binding protein [Candidatus Acidoferrales bacterium]|nr:ABC transporter substrate-binding protein [Candidatus Acidoferrales bacterium]
MSRTRHWQTTLGNLIFVLTEEAKSELGDARLVYPWVSYMVADLARKKRLRFKRQAAWRRPKFADCATALTLGILLCLRGFSLAAESPRSEIQQTIDKVIQILQDPALKGEGKKAERRAKLREIIYPRFDFTEMAKRSLGSQWQKRTPEEQREFIKAFTRLLEDSYLDQIEAYNGEKVRYVRDRQDGDFAEVDTRIVNKKGEEFAVSYRLHRADAQWKVYDITIENISLVNNYRSQFSRVLARSSFDELLRAMNEKKLKAPGKEK